MKTTKTQLELDFDDSVTFAPAVLSRHRRHRARWWFQQMHVMVDRAFDWSTAPAPPHEKIPLTLAKAR